MLTAHSSKPLITSKRRSSVTISLLVVASWKTTFNKSWQIVSFSSEVWRRCFSAATPVPRFGVSSTLILNRKVLLNHCDAFGDMPTIKCWGLSLRQAKTFFGFRLLWRNLASNVKNWYSKSQSAFPVVASVRLRSIVTRCWNWKLQFWNCCPTLVFVVSNVTLSEGQTGLMRSLKEIVDEFWSETLKRHSEKKKEMKSAF